MATKKNIKVRDLKPRKDAKGGVGTNAAGNNSAGTNTGINAGLNSKGGTLDGKGGTLDGGQGRG